MKFYLKSTKRNIDAKAEYDNSTGIFTVLKGSIVSDKVSQAEKFRSSKTVEKLRETYVKGCTVKQNVEFKSSSTAANFVTGSSTNGMIAWKSEDGKTFKECTKE